MLCVELQKKKWYCGNLLSSCFGISCWKRREHVLAPFPRKVSSVIAHKHLFNNKIIK